MVRGNIKLILAFAVAMESTIGALVGFSSVAQAAAPACPGFFEQIFLSRSALYERMAQSEAEIESALRFSADAYASLNSSFKNVKSRARSLVRTKDPHALFMNDIGVTSRGVLSPTKVAQAVDRKMTEPVKTGKQAAQNALRPGRAVVDDNQNVRLISFEETLSGHWRPLERQLSAREFWNGIDAGFSPLGGDLTQVTTDNGVVLGSDFFHDLSHFSGFSRDLDYQKGMRNVARKVVAMSDEQFELVSSRLFFISELMSCFPEGSQKTLTRFVTSVRGEGSSEPLTRVEYMKLFSTKSDSELKALWSRTQAELPPIKSVGGTSSDTLSRFDSESFEELAPLEFGYSGGQNARLLAQRYERAAMLDALATRMTIADHLQSVSPSQFAEQVLEGNPSSPAVKLLCRNPILWTDTQTMNEVCRK